MQDFLEVGCLASGPEQLSGSETLSSDERAELKRRYSALLIQLDRLRNELTTIDPDVKPAGSPWSVKEIIGHLIDTDRDIWWPRIELLLSTDEPQFSTIDPQALIIKHGWRTLPLEDILAQLMRVRWSYAMRLNSIDEQNFARAGEHYSIGRINLDMILQILVAHDTHYLGRIRDLVEMDSNRDVYS